ARDRGGDEGGGERHQGGAPPVPGGPRHPQGDVAPRLRHRRGHRDDRGPQGDGGAGAARGGDADRGGAVLQAVPPRRRDRGRVPHGRDDRRDPDGVAAQQWRRRVGQRQKVHRDGGVRRQGKPDPQGGGRG